jgi:hypothetical protein
MVTISTIWNSYISSHPGCMYFPIFVSMFDMGQRATGQVRYMLGHRRRPIWNHISGPTLRRSFGGFGCMTVLNFLETFAAETLPISGGQRATGQVRYMLGHRRRPIWNHIQGRAPTVNCQIVECWSSPLNVVPYRTSSMT